jgi:hypothetical protein
LRDIENLKNELLAIVYRSIETLKQLAENGTPEGDENIEPIYPLGVIPALFKGTKPAAVIFGDERVAVKTWRDAYGKILRQCATEKWDGLMYLRNRVSGRKRVMLSDKPDGMDVPIELAEGLYAEAYFDTESLIQTLTERIFKPVEYDYSGISVALAKRGRRG